MGVLHFLWRGVLAFDRVGSRIPQLVQITFVELFFVMPLAFFIGKVIDIRGALGVPGTGGAVPPVYWAALMLSLACGFFVVRSLVRPRVREGSWAPMARMPLGGDVDLLMANGRARITYDYLSSHPSYALLLLLILPLPLSMWFFSRDEGDSTFYWRVTGLVAMALLAGLAIARVLAWYVFKFGRKELERVRPRIAWEIAWKPVLMLVVFCYAITCIPLAVMFWQDARRVAAWPVVAVGDRAGTQVRVEGELTSDPVYWAPDGTGRGGNNYAGAGVLVRLDGGGEALLLAESMTVSDFKAAVAEAKDGVVHTQGTVIDGITETQQKYYGLDPAAFPGSGDDRVLVLLQTP
ncbi:hypothetical protein [Mycolicibacterium sp. J2]|uniref:hypothetical protein n=1 Tax=Mycolicibacterium sp. J2 TaxID=2993511 RepID=UPI00224A6E9B|nr:hypothetical protein [Mycolicibacterium sp. J2]MCX2714556.1 hypothetical protein [Mycolicibacterium sp. J2]